MKSGEPYADIELIQHILKGEVALFEILVRRNNPFLYKTGRAYKYSHEDTQDLMQDTFIDAFSNLSKFENRSSFKTWIIKIMLNNCFRKQQKSSFKKEVSYQVDDNAIPVFSNRTDTSKTVMNRELNGVIENALQHIPADYRMVFSLREINGLNVQETADVLSITETNVKVRLNRAKAMLRKEVERSYTAEDIFEFHLVYCDQIVHHVMNRIKESTRC